MKEVSIRKVLERVNKEISAFHDRGSKYARGLSGEGYKGGYRDALMDALLFMRGVRPHRSHWWEDE